MEFEEVLPLLRAGYKIYRRSKPMFFTIHFETIACNLLDKDDILAEDWEVEKTFPSGQSKVKS